METDFFNYINDTIISQLGNDELLYLIAFFFKNLNLAKCNYKTYKKELLVIMRYFE